MDLLHEIFDTIKKNKLRTFLTGFSVSWGIFMLIVLLGAGNGLKNGVISNFTWRAMNALSIRGGWTSMPYAGIEKGRKIKLDDRDLLVMTELFSAQQYNLSATINVPDTVVSYGKEYGNYRLSGVFPNLLQVVNATVKAGNGRFINQSDLIAKSKVIVIHESHAKVLFPKTSPLGKYVVVDNAISYQVVGVYSDNNERFSNEAYIPFTTAATIYNKGTDYTSLQMLTRNVETADEAKEFQNHLRSAFARLHIFNPEDKNALYIWDSIEQFSQTMKIFWAINMFVWVIGIGTLIAGIVGVSNIMLITVKERTREFGIRKAIGATPYSILKLIIIESVLITGVFGYIGMVFGIGLTEGINYVMEMAAAQASAAAGPAGSVDTSMTVFRDPTVGLGIVSAATSIIVIAGVIAGYFPARKAVSVKPIEALRYE